MTKIENETVRYPKSALMASKKYRDVVDVLAIRLEDEKEYTLTEVEKIIKDFSKTVIKEKINGKE